MTTVFFSYSHRDESWRNELEVHLAALKRQDLIDTWHDRRIPAGDEWQQRISEYLEGADVILLLISPYFIASDYCYDIEMTRALERHHAGEARVIPVVLEPCLWQDLPFGKLNAVPADGRPVSKFANHHDAFVEIAGAIRDALPAPRAAARTASIPQETVVEHSPRSSNLRVKRQFTDEDKHLFLSESFDYIRRFFEGSIEELATRNTEITGTVQRVDAIRFTARLYRQGREVASCTIWQGSQTGFGGGINFVHGIKLDGNSLNESLSVDDDGYAMFLTSLGFMSSREQQFGQHGAAEELWRAFIERLQ